MTTEEREVFSDEYYKTLILAKQAVVKNAEKYIPKLYKILTEVENKDPLDAREIIAKDLVSYYSKATITKFLPVELKDKLKSEFGKKGAEKTNKKKKEEVEKKRQEEERKKQIISITNTGQQEVSGAGLNPAESSPSDQKEPNSGSSGSQNKEQQSQNNTSRQDENLESEDNEVVYQIPLNQFNINDLTRYEIGFLQDLIEKIWNKLGEKRFMKLLSGGD